MIFFTLFAIPLLLAAASFVWSKGITWQELAAQVAAQALVAAASVGIIYSANVGDNEVWNGVVRKKEREVVSCSHAYPCNCREECSGSGENRSCSTVCDTCYMHDFDVDWMVYTSNSESIEIDRVDLQGLDQPPRWTAVRIGEPTAVQHYYTNYIRGAPDTLFRHQGLVEKYRSKIPNYPDNIYDDYRLNRVVRVGGVQKLEGWDTALSELNARVGRVSQANVVIVLVRGLPNEYYYALEEAWLGGKKNDIVLVVGVDYMLKPTWVSVMAWTTNELFKVKLRDDVLAMPTLEGPRLLSVIETDVLAGYKRKPMKDFEYLQASITPTTTQWTVSMLFGLLIAVGMSWLAHKHDWFGYEGRDSYVNRFESSYRYRG